jgi:RNA polymerase sigma-70 factor (family 1)
MEDKREILVQQLKEGSENAFRELVDHFQDHVFNTCFGFVYNRADADDIAQEVFIEVYHSIASFKENSSLSTWIYRIAVNKSLDFIRHSRRKKRWAELFRLAPVDNENTDHWFVDHETPQSQIEREERRKILHRAIQSLPENQRTVFTLHKIEELSYNEIAEIMKVSLPAVESLMHRAKCNLRSKLEKYYLDEKNEELAKVLPINNVKSKQIKVQ